MTSFQKILVSATVLMILATFVHKTYRVSHPLDEPTQAIAAIQANDKELIKAPGNGHSFRAPNSRGGTRNPEQLAKAIVALRNALHPPKLRRGVQSYPPEEVLVAIRNFGFDRKEAISTLLEAAEDPDLEVRSRAISAMGLIGRSALPEHGLLGDPAPEAKALLWKTLQENDELASLALAASRMIGFTPEEIPALANTLALATNVMLKRYLPEALSKIITEDPAGAASYVPFVENLLHNPDPAVQFEAACALAKSKAATTPEILEKVMAGLRSEGSQQLMALETLQTLGSSASTCIPAISDFANTTSEDALRDVAYQTIGKINGALRNTSPEVDQALKSEETMVYWNDKFASGNYGYQDLLDALKEPLFAATAAKHLGEWGVSAKNAVPELISSLSGQDQNKRDEIVKAISQIDPQAEVEKVSSKPIIMAAQSTVRYLESSIEDQQQPGLAKLLDKVLIGNSDWYTPQEVRDLAKQLALRDDNVYRAFVDEIVKIEPNLTSLFVQKTTQ